MPRVALALPPEVEYSLVTELHRHGYDIVGRCNGGDELATVLATVRADLVVVSAAPGYLSAKLLEGSDAVGARLVALVGTDAERRHAASIGLYEVVDLAASWEVLEAAMLGLPSGAQPPPGPVPQGSIQDSLPASSGRVVAVWGPGGAPGRTSLAITIAAELASAGHSVALADVDTHGASIAPALGLLDEAPGFAAACRLAGADSLNRAELERIGQRYLSARGSFWVLTGIGRPSRWPELSAERVTTAIRECRSWVDFTVVDVASSLENDEEISSDLFAPRRNAATISALREADEVIAVGSADPVGLSRFLRAHVDLLETLETDRVTVVMNKIRSAAIGLNPTAQVTQTLQRFGGITSPILVPHDQGALDAAILTGKTLLDVASKSPARVAIGELVRARILQPLLAMPREVVTRSRFEPTIR